MMRPQAAREDGLRRHHEPQLELLGDSPAMVGVRDLIARVAETDATVLIRGESGTGKELVARALRAGSPRRDKAFVKVNCAALPAELLESEMFGVERGAFTGALQSKPGKFEFANHGTIFLDEIAEMLPALQAKLLHVLQDGEFSRLGGGDVRVDVRIVAATNRKLEDAVATGAFREDLFFRLNVVSIALPPLRERRDEIPTLVRHFLVKYSAHYNRPGVEISRATLDAFMEYEWPGNIRELENVIQRIVILGAESSPTNPLMPRRGERRVFQERRQSASGPVAALAPVERPSRVPSAPQPVAAAPLHRVDGGVSAAGLQDAPRPASPAANEPTSLKLIGRNAARAAERELMLRMLNRTRWNRKEAAEILGISYKALLYKIKEHRLDDPLTDPDPPTGGSTGP
ncbi:MAG TPA: sigma-54 dependent transcriptional regulator [Vicinamibacterales bacterium]|nr:sigma-54 dependent transcriptional regulator [Vicinamibacterales bacterium]